MKPTVWVVLVSRLREDGLLSSRILGVYATKKLAKEHIKQHREIDLICPGDAVYIVESEIFNEGRD